MKLLINIFKLLFGFSIQGMIDGNLPGIMYIATESNTTNSTSTTETTSSGSSELLDQKISSVITKMMPYVNPVDTVIRSVSKTEKTNSWKYEWYSSDVRGRADTIASTFDTSASGTYDSVGKEHTVTVTHPGYWNVHDTALFPNNYDGDGNPIMAIVVSKSGSTLNLVAVNGKGPDNDNIPDLTAGTVIVRIGHAKDELAAQTTPFNTYPQKLWNYNQIHMAQVEQSAYDKSHLKEANWDINDFKEQAIYDMKLNLEETALWGARGKTYDREADNYKYTSGGLCNYIATNLTYTDGSLTESKFYEWCETLFAANAGSQLRYAFIGKTLMRQISQISSIQKQLDSNKSTFVKWGLTFNEITTNFGTLRLLLHRSFNDVGWEKRGVVLDMANVVRYLWTPFEIKKLDLKTSGVRNADAFVLKETSGLALKYQQDDVHAIIKPA